MSACCMQDNVHKAYPDTGALWSMCWMNFWCSPLQLRLPLRPDERRLGAAGVLPATPRGERACTLKEVLLFWGALYQLRMQQQALRLLAAVFLFLGMLWACCMLGGLHDVGE